jgi:hypothetical protein
MLVTGERTAALKRYMVDSGLCRELAVSQPTTNKTSNKSTITGSAFPVNLRFI